MLTVFTHGLEEELGAISLIDVEKGRLRNISVHLGKPGLHLNGLCGVPAERHPVNWLYRLVFGCR